MSYVNTVTINMPHILVRNTMNMERPNETFLGTSTYIDFAEEGAASFVNGRLTYGHGGLHYAIQTLPATLVSDGDSRYITYQTTQPPYLVLDRLKRHGYRVIGVNTVKDTSMWTCEYVPSR